MITAKKKKKKDLISVDCLLIDHQCYYLIISEPIYVSWVCCFLFVQPIYSASCIFGH